MKNQWIQTLSMAGGIILLAGIAAWLGLAHGCEAPVANGVVAGRVTIVPDLQDLARKNKVLFVIVRRPEGPPRPLAVKRIENPTFPVEFEITNQDQMVQGSELRGVVDVIARLDRDGMAGPLQPGDLEGQYEGNPTTVGGRNIEIQINQAH